MTLLQRLSHLKLSAKLIIGFSVILGLSITVNIFAIIRLQQVQDVAIEISENWMPSIYTVSDINTNNSNMMILQQQHIFALSEVEMAAIERQMDDIKALVGEYDKQYTSLLKKRSALFGDDESVKRSGQVFELYKENFMRYMAENEAIVDSSRLNNKEEAKEKLREDSYKVYEECNQLLSQLTQDNLMGGAEAAKRSTEIYMSSRLLIVVSMIISVIISIVVAVVIFLNLLKQIGGEPRDIAFITRQVSEGDLTMRFDKLGTGMYSSIRQMVETLREVAEITNNIAKGDFARRVRVKSEKDLLAVSINQMIDNFKTIVNQAKIIARGDYNVNINLRSDGDELGAALQLMTDSLRKNKQESAEQDWIKDGINRLGQELSGNLSLKELCQKAITFLARYSDSGSAVIYVYDKEAEVLKLYASYAFTERNALANHFKFGEGIVGQVALERSPILLKNIRRGETYISSGLIEEPPLNAYAIPLIFEQALYGVLELSSFEAYTLLKRDFLEQAGRMVGTYLYSVQQTDKVKGLLAISEEATRSAEARAKEIEHVNAKLEDQRKELQNKSEELRKRNDSLILAKEELDRRAEQLELSNKYKSEFLANMSHELRTPLNSIIMLSKMLGKNEQRNLSDKDVKKSQIIYKSGEELLRLINDILDLSKIEAGKMVIHPTVFTSTEILSDMHDLFHTLTQEKGIALNLEDNAKINLFTDRDRLAQVLRNFLSNSVKFTKKGSITLRVAPHPTNNALAMLSVIDTGIGIPKNKQQVIFEAFKQADGTTSREYGGTGLGLSIARELAKLLQGRIELESEPGKGSNFTIVLPIRINEDGISEEEIKNNNIVVVKDAAYDVQIEKANTFSTTDSLDKLKNTAAVREHKETIPTPTAQTTQRKAEDDRHNIKEYDKVILIIEDELQFAESMAEVIRNERIKVVIAMSGAEGIEFAQKYKPKGIILDLGLPDMDGSEVLKKIKSIKELRHIPVEIISARDKDMSLLGKGAIGFLQKPVDEHLLRNAMNEIVNFGAKAVKDLLIVEDDTDQLEALQELLRADDIEVKGVKTQAEAIAEIQKGIYDGAIVDLGLKEGNGYELCTYINENYPKVPVIIYTGRSLSIAEEKKLRKAAQSIILKTQDNDEKLKDEVSLFLHRMERNFDKEKIHKHVKSTEEEQTPEAFKDEYKEDGSYHSDDLEPTVSIEERIEKAVAEKIKLQQAAGKGGLPSQFSEAEAAKIIKNKNVLVVDDDIRNIFVIASALENFEANILEALNGKEAIDVLSEERVDLIMMDTIMPEMNGLDAIKAIRANPKLKHLPIVAITGKAQEEDRQECLAAGANAYIPKPVDYEQLLQTVCTWIGKRVE
ncbi:MAG: response regulator [Cytophagales bacterium]|nr:MAG: response regulator [Cytophagales bacterium]TAF59546.1 MAG: response regulator [Cytophagales bacterium]